MEKSLTTDDTDGTDKKGFRDKPIRDRGLTVR